MTYIVIRLVAVAGACLWLALGEQIAHATATSANVDSTRLVRLGGTRYRYVEGSLNGTIAATTGRPVRTRWVSFFTTRLSRIR